MENKNITINISTRAILKIIGVLLVLAFAWFIRDIILIAFISVMIAIVIEPLVNFLENKRIPRGVGVILIYIIIFFIFFLSVRMIVPPIIEQVSRLSSNFPYLWEKIVENFNYLKDFSDEKGLTENIQGGLKGLQSILEQAASGVYSSVVVIFQSLVNLLIILTIVFYLVVQKGIMDRLLKLTMPAKHYPYFSELFQKIKKKISDWAWGQLILALIIGFFTFVCLLFFMPKYALVLALIAGITEIVPYIGPILAAIPAVFLGFTVEPFSVLRGFAVLLIYIVIQQLEEKVIVPKVMEKKVGLNPVITIIIILIGYRLAGIIGIILAVPVATSIGIIINDLIQRSESKNIKTVLDNNP